MSVLTNEIKHRAEWRSHHRVKEQSRALIATVLQYGIIFLVIWFALAHRSDAHVLLQHLQVFTGN